MAFLTSNPYFLSLLSGLLLWVSFPAGGGLTPVLAVALVPLLLAVFQADVKKSLFCGLITGVIHYCALMYWIVIVVGKYGGLPWILSLLALVLLTLYMSLYFVLFSLLSRAFLHVFPGIVSLLFVPALWVGLDWFRGVFLTGLPWMDLGYALYRTPLLIQVADLTGHHGLSFLIVFVNVLIFQLFRPPQTIKNYLLLLLLFICLFAGVGYYSVSRYQEVEQLAASVDIDRARIGVVQGNIDQSQKWSPEKQQETVDTYIGYSEKLISKNSSLLVIWPETALPFYPATNEHMDLLRNMVAPGNISLLSGAPWYEIIDREARKVKFYNSAMLLTGEGGIEDKYSKNHLVPFGEYVPLKKYLPFINPLVEAVGDFSPGQIDRPLHWQEAELGVLICFESVFPDLSRKWILAGANILVNLTNDAWYGKSSAPHQSLAMAVFRAVETRRSLVRSANTGISAFISPTGQIIRQSSLFESWAEAEDVILLDNITFWVKYGYLFGPLCLFITILGTGSLTMRKRWQRSVE